MVGTTLVIAILAWGVGSYLTVVSSGSIGTYKIADQAQAFYAAEAGAHRMLHEINATGATSTSGTLNAGTYTGNYSATYSNDVITSTGTVDGISSTVTVRTIEIPSSVRGAVTENSSTYIAGSIIMDGRDYDAADVLTDSSGLYGISAAGMVTQMGSCQIGGNGAAPAAPAASYAYEQLADPFNDTDPWDLLGVDQSWFEANVPVQTTPPSANFNGIYYYNPPTGTWSGASLGSSSGILIVHNSTNSATMKNASGKFTGLIIADQFTHNSGSLKVVGGLITTNQVGNFFGYGSAKFRYSSEVLSELKSLLGNQTSNWRKILSAGSWTD